MNKKEFKKTIEYIVRLKKVKPYIYIIIAANLFWNTIGITLCLINYKIDSTRSIALLISLFIVGIFVSILPLKHLIYYYRQISHLYSYLSNVYIFDYKLNQPIETTYFTSRYLISFEYDGKKYELLTSLINDTFDLDNKKVKVGFIKETKEVLILSKIDN